MIVSNASLMTLIKANINSVKHRSRTLSKVKVMLLLYSIDQLLLTI